MARADSIEDSGDEACWNMYAFLRPVSLAFGEAGEWSREAPAGVSITCHRVLRSCCGVLKTRHWVSEAVFGF
jgi:hypothetical protein